MTRAEAIRIICAAVREGVIVSANGMISRETFACTASGAARFYMLGSMGLAATIGLGIALAEPSVLVTVLDGDGNVLMNLGALAMIGAAKPRRFLHVVLDNESYDSTGGQPSLSASIQLEVLAFTCGYTRAERVDTAESLAAALARTPGGAQLLLVRVAPGASRDVPRIDTEPAEIAASVRRLFAKPELTSSSRA
jgi:thiamine pyrophosphate-dependent acetolactate synthase large subunit-like protein